MNKNMKKIFLTGATLAILGSVMTGCSWFKEEKVPINNTTNNITNTNVNTQVEETMKEDEFIRYEEDGTRVNTSANIINSTKRLGVLEFKNIELSEIVNITKIKAEVHNTSTEKIIEKEIVIKLLDKNGKAITELNTCVCTIEPGAFLELNAQSTLDFANAYDIEFIEKVSQ